MVKVLSQYLFYSFDGLYSRTIFTHSLANFVSLVHEQSLVLYMPVRAGSFSISHMLTQAMIILIVVVFISVR